MRKTWISRPLVPEAPGVPSMCSGNALRRRGSFVVPQCGPPPRPDRPVPDHHPMPRPSSLVELRASGAPQRSRLRAVGAAAAPRGDVCSAARGAHRTRVSEMRLAGARTADWRPERVDACKRRPYGAMERDGEDEVHLRTG